MEFNGAATLAPPRSDTGPAFDAATIRASRRERIEAPVVHRPSVLYARLADVFGKMPPQDEWLTAGELDELALCSGASRHASWLCGRWIAKQLVLRHLNARLALRDVAIRSRDSQGRPVRPTIIVRERAVPGWSLSIAHGEQGSLAALSTRETVAVGVDLAPVPRRVGESALVFWFSRRERREFATGEPRKMAALWAIKEGAFKASNAGEHFLPRRLEIRRNGNPRLACYDTGRQTELPVRAETWEVDGWMAACVTISAATVRIDGTLPRRG